MRPRPRRRAVSVALAMIATLACSSPHALAASSARAEPVVQQLAVLMSGHRAHTRPTAASRALGDVAAIRPITGERTALPVIGRATDRDGTPWLRVMLPGRPDGATGWIAEQGTRAGATPWGLVVHLSARSLDVYRDGRLMRSFQAVVGKPSTPTPTGRFFVEETLQMYRGEPGGPFALALSARSNALREYEGGPGQIAVHGRDQLGGTLGAAESHGCIRLATASITWLAERIGPGVPVTILG